MSGQLFIWWLVIQLLGLLALPLTRVLFGALPDRGYAFSKTLGLLLTGYLAWLMAMLGLAPFGAPLLVVCAVAVGAAGLLALRQHGSHVRLSVRGSFLRARWRLILGYEALFLAALVFLALLRSYNPDPWGTERPMDFALFNAIRRSDVFPPHDPWLSGYSINYYYFGYLLMASMSLLSGLGPEASFSLALALIFALTALGVVGVVANLVALTGDRRQATGDRRQATGVADQIANRQSPIVNIAAVLLAVVLVLFAGNQISALQVVTGVKMTPALEGVDLQRAIINGLGKRGPLHLEQPFNAWDFGPTSVVTPTDMLENFDIWYPSRALWDSFPDPADPDALPLRRYTITEFPFFSFWLGDMHPHVMALPFGLLALALALNTAVRTAVPRFGQGRRGWLELVLTGVVLGSLYTINSWDYPTYLLLFLGTLLLLCLRRRSVDRERGSGEEGVWGSVGAEALEEVATARTSAASLGVSSAPHLNISTHWSLAPWWRSYVLQAGVVVLASLALFLPFHLTFTSLVGSKAPLVDLPLLGRLTRTIGLVTWDKTALHTFLIIFGLFFVPLVAYVAAQAVRVPAARTALWVTLAALPVGWLLGFPLLFLLPLAVYAAMLAVERRAQPATGLVLWVFALACLICFGTEIVYIRDVFESRMNTIFKFYYQIWLLWGVLAGYAVWWLLSGTTDDGRRTNALRPARLSIVYRLSSVVLFAILLAGALVYPWHTAVRAFREDTRVGLAGKTPRQNTPAGAAAINWLRQNAASNAVVLEAVGGSYDGALGAYPGFLGAGGVSASTGLQTVLGWPGHEQQWRGGDPAALAAINERQNDIATIYSTPDVGQAQALLQKYGVDYIYVGAAEQAAYPPEGLAKLAQLGTPVFQQDEVVIYAVNG